MHAIIRQSTQSLIYGPTTWDQSAFNAELQAVQPGFAPFLPAVEPTAALTWAGEDLAVVPVTLVQPSYDLVTQMLVAGAPVVSGNTVTVTYTIAPLPALTPAQAYAIAIAAGVTVISTSSIPALASPGKLLACDPTTCIDIAEISDYITVNQKFPDGQLSFPMKSPTGAIVVMFTTSTSYQTVATAIADYVTACDLALNSDTSMPLATITIA